MKFPKRNGGHQEPNLEVIEKEPVVAESFVFSYSQGVIIEADDPKNPLGRKQTMVTDTAAVRTADGRVLYGMRANKSFGPKGSMEDQANDPFLRHGAVLAFRSGAPLLGKLCIRRSPDLVEGFYPPEFQFYPMNATEDQPQLVQIAPDEAFAAAKAFDELYFPTDREVKMVGLPADIFHEIRVDEARLFGIGQGLREK